MASAQYLDEARTMVRYTDDAGRVSFVPASEDNARFLLIRDGRPATEEDPAIPATPIAEAIGPSLEGARAETIAALEAEYGARLAQGALWNGRFWDIRPDAAATLDLVLTAVDRYGDAKHDGTWTDIGGADVAVSSAELPALAEACFDRAAALGRQYRALMGAAFAAQTIDALDAIDVGAGWPA